MNNGEQIPVDIVTAVGRQVLQRHVEHGTCDVTPHASHELFVKLSAADRVIKTTSILNAFNVHFHETVCSLLKYLTYCGNSH